MELSRRSQWLHCRGDVQGLRGLRKEALVRAQPEPLDGGDEAAVRAEPPARPRPPRRQSAARLRLHPLPQGRQGAEGSVASCGIKERESRRSAQDRRSAVKLVSVVAAFGAWGGWPALTALGTVGAVVAAVGLQAWLGWKQRSSRPH